MASAADTGSARRFGAWIRYGDPLTDEQEAFALEHYRVALLQPWETERAARMKAARPDLTLLAYKCLSSTRSYEPGPVYSSGLSFAEADAEGERWFGHRLDGSRIEWNTYPGHWQMAVWDESYQDRWIANVVGELGGSPFDGVIADNDVFDDYYGLCPPIEGGRQLADLRAALDGFVPRVGRSLNDIGKILVPNIAESRRDPGRWERHAAFGGGYEEVWLGYEPETWFDHWTVVAQAPQVAGPGLTILRTASDGTNDHPNFRYAAAAFWVFGGGDGGAFTATSHDGYDATPWIPEQDFDLGRPVRSARRRGNGVSREFTDGWAAINMSSAGARPITFRPPAGLVDRDGRPVRGKLRLPPHHGVVLRRAA